MSAICAVRRWLATVLVVLCVGCAAGGAPAPAPAEAAEAAAAAPEYRLGPGDKLHISVYGEADLSGDFTIGPNGSISYPLVGEVAAQGMSVAQFTTALGDVLRSGYVRQPSISVEVAAYRPYYIMGEVGAPGTYAFTSRLTIMNAVATAGGFSYRADTRRVFIQHSDAANEQEYRLTSAMLVQPGDTIRIPERRF